MTIYLEINWVLGRYFTMGRSNYLGRQLCLIAIIYLGGHNQLGIADWEDEVERAEFIIQEDITV